MEIVYFNEDAFNSQIEIFRELVEIYKANEDKFIDYGLIPDAKTFCWLITTSYNDVVN